MLNHIHFIANFAKSHYNHYNAYTDGALQSMKDHHSLAILEVKRRIQRLKQVPIEMQETAEMVAWILKGSGNLPNFNSQ